MTNINKSKKTYEDYKGFTLETSANGQGLTTVVYNKAKEPVAGTFSLLDEKNSVQKAKDKIDQFD